MIALIKPIIQTKPLKIWNTVEFLMNSSFSVFNTPVKFKISSGMDKIQAEPVWNQFFRLSSSLSVEILSFIMPILLPSIESQELMSNFSSSQKILVST